MWCLGNEVCLRNATIDVSYNQCIFKVGIHYYQNTINTSNLFDLYLFHSLLKYTYLYVFIASTKHFIFFGPPLKWNLTKLFLEERNPFEALKKGFSKEFILAFFCFTHQLCAFFLVRKVGGIIWRLPSLTASCHTGIGGFRIEIALCGTPFCKQRSLWFEAI